MNGASNDVQSLRETRLIVMRLINAFDTSSVEAGWDCHTDSSSVERLGTRRSRYTIVITVLEKDQKRRQRLGRKLCLRYDLRRHQGN